MRIVSANLNQHLGSEVGRTQFHSWLRRQTATLVLAQEPFAPSRKERPLLEGYSVAAT